jgi:preprotein translocase subunit SecG
VEINVILLVLHVFLALGMISLILLQKGAGASAGAAFGGGGGGGGGAGSVFGASGSSNFLSKTTGILATLFFLNSLALAFLAANRDQPDSVVDLIETGTVIESEVPMVEAIDESIPLPVDTTVSDDIPPPE